MAIDTQTIAWSAIAIGFVGIAWAIFWPVEPHPGVNPVSCHWDLVYVDDDGIMQFTLVRVLKINPTSRRMTAWCSTTGAERIFKLSKIVKATDVRSGARINIGRLIDKPSATRDSKAPVTAQRIHDDAAQSDAAHSDVGSWWSTSRLGMH